MMHERKYRKNNLNLRETSNNIPNGSSELLGQALCASIYNCQLGLVQGLEHVVQGQPRNH